MTKMPSSKSMPKMPIKMFTNLSLLTRVLLALIAVSVAYLIIQFGMVTYEAFTDSSAPSSVKKTSVKLYSMVGCGHCEKFAPEWNNLNKKYPSGTKLPDGSVLELKKYSTDNPDDLKIINKDNIAGFPTITITFPDATSAMPYNDSRTVDALWSAITKSS